MPHSIVYTAGYTGLKPADLHAAAEKLDAYLVDTRISPYSRVPYWMGSSLKTVWGARYVHIRNLGNKNYKLAGAPILLQDADEGTWQLSELMRDKPVILICACTDHETCHRSVAAQEMADRYGFEVIHLSKADVLKLAEPDKPDPPEQLSLL